jgi:hypothetical protein
MIWRRRRVINLDIGSQLRCVVTGCLVDFIRGHLAGDIAHLLTDVVPACAGSKSLELRFDVNGGLAIKPRRAELETTLVMHEAQVGMLRIGAPRATMCGESTVESGCVGK